MNRKSKIGVITILLMLNVVFVVAQKQKLDSLYKRLNDHLNDTSRLIVYGLIGDEYYRLRPDSSRKYFLKILDELKVLKPDNSAQIKFKDRLLVSINANLGLVEGSFGNNKLAMEYFNRAIEFEKKINDKKQLYSIYNNIGYHYNSIGDVKLAIEYFEKSIDLIKEPNGNLDQARSLNNMASLYTNFGELDKALEFVNESIAIKKRLNNKSELAQSYASLGRIYFLKDDFSKALNYFKEAYSLFEKTNNIYASANVINSMAVTYSRMGNKELSILYMNKALNIQREAKDYRGISSSLNNMSAWYYKEKNYKKALECAVEGYDCAVKVGNPENIFNATNKLHLIYKKMGDFQKALNYYEISIKMHDSINNELSRKASVKSQLKYDYEKQAAADSVAHAKESEVKNAQLAEQHAELKAKKNAQFALFGGLALVIIFAGFMYNRFKVTQKQKEIIEDQKLHVEEQKSLVEEKQKEILDSIHYASRIQMAQIPSEVIVQNILNKMKG